MLARDRLTLNEMSWILIKVFFGSATCALDTILEADALFQVKLSRFRCCSVGEASQAVLRPGGFGAAR